MSLHSHALYNSSRVAGDGQTTSDPGVKGDWKVIVLSKHIDSLRDAWVMGYDQPYTLAI